MKIKTSNRHMIDLVFPLALFFVFAASALIALILAADLYGSTADRLQINDQGRTVLSYVSEKVRQSDTGGSMEVAEVDGIPCFALSSEYNNTGYTTYIYEYDGMLKELFIRSDTQASLKDGMDITEIRSFSVNKKGKNLYQFTAIDSQGNESSLLVSERSEP